MKSKFRQYFKKNALTEEEAVLYSLPSNSLYQATPDLQSQLPINDDQSRLKMVRYVLGSYLMVIVLVLGAFLISSRDKDPGSSPYQTMIIVSGVLIGLVIGILVGYEIYIKRNASRDHVPLENANDEHEE